MNPVVNQDISPIDIAWAAGIFEGEGCFAKFKNPSGKYYLSLQINMTDEDIIERFYNIFGVGTFALWHPPSHKNTGRKPQYRWRTSGANAEAVFWLIAVHLGKRRIARYSELFQEIKLLNKKFEKDAA